MHELRGKKQSRILNGQDPTSQATVPGSLVWWMAVHVRLHESGELLFRGSQELFNGCISRQLINSPGILTAVVCQALPPYKLHKNGQMSMDEGCIHTGPGSSLSFKASALEELD